MEDASDNRGNIKFNRIYNNTSCDDDYRVFIGRYTSKEVINDIRLYPYTIIKQIIMPILFWWVLKFIVVDKVVLGVLVVLVAMPVGSSTVMFCNQYEGNVNLASKSIFNYIS